MQHQSPQSISKAEALSVFSSSDIEAICNALVDVTFNCPDREWVERRCLDLLKHANVNVRGLAATCLGHLARIYRDLNLPEVLPILHEMKADREMGGRAEDALGDIEMYIEHISHMEGSKQKKSVDQE